MDAISLNISLPKTLKQYVESQVSGGTCITPGECVRELIREDRKRRWQEEIEMALVAGLYSGAPLEADPAYWARKRKRLREWSG